jgi:hypothetical protein
MGREGATRWGFTALNLAKTYLAPLLFRPLAFARGLRLLFGDQAMVCRREAFRACGGFDDTLPLMEDAELCLRIASVGRMRLIRHCVRTSDRRVARWGLRRAWPSISGWESCGAWEFRPKGSSASIPTCAEAEETGDAGRQLSRPRYRARRCAGGA